MMNDNTPLHINPVQWAQAQGFARQASARIFRDGGSAQDAVREFGIREDVGPGDWARAVTLIAEVMCAAPVRTAA